VNDDVALTGGQGMQHSCMQPVALLLTVKRVVQLLHSAVLHSLISKLSLPVSQAVGVAAAAAVCREVTDGCPSSLTGK